MKIIFLGPPGSGKGTQSDIIRDKLKIPTVSTGNILREAIRKGTDIGLKAKEYTESGKLVPDNIIMDIVVDRLQKDDCKDGYILDGVPRTLSQAESLEKMGVIFDGVISMEVPDEIVERRLTGRRVCNSCGMTFHMQMHPPKIEGKCDICGGELIQRSDDMPETVRERVAIYHDKTEPLKAFYEKRGNLKLVAGQYDIHKTTGMIFRELGITE